MGTAGTVIAYYRPPPPVLPTEAVLTALFAKNKRNLITSSTSRLDTITITMERCHRFQNQDCKNVNK